MEGLALGTGVLMFILANHYMREKEYFIAFILGLIGIANFAFI